MANGIRRSENERWCRALRLYSYALCGLFFSALLIVAVRGYVLHEPYPRNTFLFDPSVKFTDFTLYGTRFESLHRGGPFYFVGKWVFSYFPATTFAFAPFFVLGAWNTDTALSIYLAFLCAGAVCLMIAVFLNLRRDRVPRCTLVAWILTCVFSYPLLVTFDRANIEMVVLLAVAGGVYCFINKQYSLAAILIGFAAAMKLVPLILILLFVQKKKHRAVALLLAVVIGLNVSALLWISPNIYTSTKGWLGEMSILRSDYVVRYIGGEIGFEHSAFSCFKQLAALFLSGERLAHAIARMYPVYVIGAATFFAFVYLLRLRKLPLLNNFFALIICQLILPPFSADYKLLHLYIPFTLFIFFFQSSRSAQITSQRMNPVLILLPCAFAFTPQSYFIVNEVSFGGQVKCLTLAFLFLVVLRTPMFTALDEVKIESAL